MFIRLLKTAVVVALGGLVFAVLPAFAAPDHAASTSVAGGVDPRFP